MTCPPGTGCARRADCQDGYCPGRFAPTARGFGVDTARSTSALQRGFDTRRVRAGQPPTDTHQPTPASGGTVEWLHIRPGGHRVDGPAGTTHRIALDPAQPPSDTEAAFWLPEAPTEPPAPWAALDAAIDRLLFASPYLWLVVAILCIASAIGLGLLAGHVSELGPDRVWALLIGGAK